MQQLKLIITFNQGFQGVESTSDMTQFSQNIDNNTQKKQNSLRQLRFWQFTFHSSLFSTWHWQLSLTKQAEKRSRNRAKKRHQTTINKQLRLTVKSVSCWESANQLQRMSGRLSQSILVILFQKCISGPLSLVSLTFRTKQLYSNFCWNLIHREWRAAEVLRDDPMTTKNMNETSATLWAEAHRESVRWNAVTLLIALPKIIGGTSHIIQLYFFLFKITFSSTRLCIDHTTFIYIIVKKKTIYPRLIDTSCSHALCKFLW